MRNKAQKVVKIEKKKQDPVHHGEKLQRDFPQGRIDRPTLGVSSSSSSTLTATEVVCK